MWCNKIEQRFSVPELPTEPIDIVPLRYCRRCGAEIYCGNNILCDRCLNSLKHRKAMLKYMQAWPERLLSFLDENQDASWSDKFFDGFYEHALGDGLDGPDFEKWHKNH